MASLVSKFKDLELYLKKQLSPDVGYGRALREAIASEDSFMEVEVLKSLGDLRLEKAKLSKDSAEFDKAAALYAAALLRCKDPDVGDMVEHRIRYMEKLCRQLLQGYSPHFRWLSPDYWGPADSNVLRVAETCLKLERSVRKSWHSVEVTYTKTLVTAIENSDMFLELEVLKSLGDFYLEKGKTTSDVSQFSKAAAMYNKALTTCGDPETKLTLEHRIRYMEKTTKEAEQNTIMMQQRSSKKSRGRKESPVHRLGNTTIAEGNMQAHHVQPHLPSEYTENFKKGDSSLARADLDSAEQHFATALKTVHVRDPTAQQYHREVEPLCKLGDVYSKRGQQTGDGGDFVKAAALYNAAIARSEDQVLNGNIATSIKEVEKAFIKCILGIHSHFSQDDTRKHKKQLKKMRNQIKLEMETIDQQLDPYVHNEDDPCVKEIEAKRAQAVRQLFEKIAQQRKEFISLLVEECIGLMGPPPCTYALIGFGSQATGLVTPYSDLEFAILVEEESEKCLLYFRNITHYLHLKVVNLGETILPALGIKSLNDFYSENPLDDWYYDSVTPRGFAFDGSMPKASKTPLGRQGTKNKPPSELICTPQKMVSKLRDDVTLYLKEGYHLSTILRNPCLIAGDQDLIDTYMDITGKILQADGGKMAQRIAKETQRENLTSFKDTETITARLIDVKKEIYRLPALVVDCLALSSGIIPTTVWETIEEMENQQVISPNNAHHLTVLTSISAELRLRTYIANGGQKENLSAMASIETTLDVQEVLSNTMNQVFHLRNEKELFRYYYTVIPLKRTLSGEEPVPNSASPLYDSSPSVQGKMYSDLCKFSLAIDYFNKALEIVGTDTEKMKLLLQTGLCWFHLGDHEKAISYYKQSLEMCRSAHDQTHLVTAVLLNNLGSAWDKLGDQKEAIRYHEQALQIKRSIHGQTTEHPDIANVLNNLGLALGNLGDYRQAISFIAQALQMYRNIYGQTAEHTVIATLLNNLGGAWCALGDYRKAICYLEQALQMRKSVYGQTTPHPGTASLLNNLGEAWHQLGDYRKAISYYELGLQMYRSVYGHTNTHPDIAGSLNNLGLGWGYLGDYRKANSYHEQALQMYRSIYGQTKAHPDFAKLLYNRGSAWSDLGDYRKAISYYEQALQMYRSIYGQTKAHPDIANSLNSLGSAWSDLGDYRKAISYLDQALQMYRGIYGGTTNTEHSHIAMSLNNLGFAWHHLGDYRKAISYHEQALQMRRSIYGQDTQHPAIAGSLNNLGLAWDNLSDNRKAISYFEQALQIFRSIYGQTKTHPDIAISLGNLGGAWHHLGDYRKAISYHEQALQMKRSIYGRTTTEHPEIATSLNNLGSAWGNLGDHRKAISYHEQALRMHKRIYGQTKAHSLIATSLNNLGGAWRHLGNYRKSISYHERSLQMYRSIYGETTPHPDIATLLNNLGMAWYNLSDHRKALSLCQEALLMARQVFPQDKNHPMIKGIESNIATISAACEDKK